MKFFFASIALVSLIACTKQQAPNQMPENVSVNAVKSIVIPKDSNEIKSCVDDVTSAGGQVLYQNKSGLLLTNLDPKDFKAPTCKATIFKNEKAEPSPRVRTPNGERDSLETMLRLVPAEDIGARTFVQNNPTYDGRGVVVAVLDTGIELDHKMLRLTSDGKEKIVDFQDFSGEGKIDLADVTLTGATFTGGDGASYTTEGVTGTGFKAGVFKGSSLIYADALSEKDTFQDVGVLVYLNAQGQLRGRIDTNDNQRFDDEDELFSYRDSKKFTKLGSKRLLSTSLTIQADGKAATLCFDDGSHGTHVAGIATGFTADGLRGVAPGAQVMGLKIGDNRLSGGSTTTASMLLAIDYAVEKGAQVINFSYGIRAGSNTGKSAIDQYVDKIAKEKGVLFSISAGNEGPGLLTMGTPAGANLAITSGAYVSKKTLHENYGYVGPEEDLIWYFSSVGPRLDGGYKPSLISPGTALSSVPLWASEHANYRGTSMAAPATTGGLALLLSAAKQLNLPQDRATITRVVFDSTKWLNNFSRVEQGRGLLQVPAALEKLKIAVAVNVEYTLSVNNPATPDGRGMGIYVRSGKLPANAFTVGVIPQNLTAGTLPLRTLRLEPSAAWITVPQPSTLWIQGDPRSFQVTLDPKIVSQPGVHAEVIKGIDELTGEVAFEVPVTVVAPEKQLTKTVTLKSGEVQRYFLEVPVGTTAAVVKLSTDGPVVWAQLLNPEGAKVTELRDAETSLPLPPLRGQTNLKRGGVYELDLVSVVNNPGRAQVNFSVELFSLSVEKSALETETSFKVAVQNNSVSIKVIPEVSFMSVQKKQTLKIQKNALQFPLTWNANDKEKFRALQLKFQTSRTFYDKMTDYPFRLFDSAGNIVTSTGLETDSTVEVSDFSAATSEQLVAEIQGAFTSTPPESWVVSLTEKKLLKTPVLLSKGGRQLLEPDQRTEFPVDLSTIATPLLEGYRNCADLNLKAVDGSLIQTIPLCELD